mmetsp:Transcript_7880/g.18871  ORF Transcript_7880/g.18871 Transcript_7880/m.18871 type:complete len:98 (-) Transcript_7880:46-339(-)
MVATLFTGDANVTSNGFLERPTLLVCDLDGTLLGEDKSRAEFFRLWKSRLFLESSSQSRSQLVYATGRSHGKVSAQTIQKWSMVLVKIGETKSNYQA